MDSYIPAVWDLLMLLLMPLPNRAVVVRSVTTATHRSRSADTRACRIARDTVSLGPAVGIAVATQAEAAASIRHTVEAAVVRIAAPRGCPVGHDR